MVGAQDKRRREGSSLVTFLGTEVPRGGLHLLDPPTCSGADTTLWPQDKEEGWTDRGAGNPKQGSPTGGSWGLRDFSPGTRVGAGGEVAY